MNEQRHVFTVVLSQTLCGTFANGLFYGWGAISEAINIRFNPSNPYVFINNHGTFGAVIVLVTGALPMPLLQHLVVTKHLFTEFQIQLLGAFLTSIGLFLAGVSLRYRLLWLYYSGGTVLAGIGGLCLYRRIVFSHQLWFKHINRQNLGSGLLGFGIGAWTVVFFAISTHMLSVFTIDEVLFVYAAVCFPTALYPTLTIVELDPSAYSNSQDEDSTIDSKVDSKIDIEIGVDKVVEDGKCMDIDKESNNTINRQIELTNYANQNRDNYIPIDKEISLDDQTNRQKDNQIDNQIDKQISSQIDSHIDSHIDSFMNTQIERSPDRLESLSLHQLLDQAKSLNIECDHLTGAIDLQFYEILTMPETWIITVFFAAVLTPGWGIKLGSYAMLRNLFGLSLDQSAVITSIYVTMYALGRLFSGLLADRIGLFSTFYLIIIIMFCALIIIPQSSIIPHSGPDSQGAHLFIGLLWLIGLLYGGSIALFYSVVFEIFGARNYKSVFSVTICGFALSVIIGGVSGAYSFSQTAPSETNALASRWFYAMAGGLVIAFIFLTILKPIQYHKILKGEIDRLVRLNSPRVLSKKYSRRYIVH